MAFVLGPELTSVGLSLAVAFAAVLIDLVPAVVLGVVLARWKSPFRPLLEGVAMAPLVLPPVVTGYVMLFALGRHGFIGAPLFAVTGLSLPFTTFAAVLAAAVVSFPLFVRAVRLSVEAIPEGLEDAALTLGATKWQARRRVLIPLIAPGILAGAVLAFARSLGEFGATIVFAGNMTGVTQTLPLAVYSFAQRPDGASTAIRLVILSVLVSVVALAMADWLGRKVAKAVGR
jgi:molybdate transport system permease protein